MDVLRPPLIYVGGRCYRKNTVQNREYVEEEEDEATFQGQDTYMDEVCDAFTNIEETDKGYRVALDIPSPYFKYIIGKKGETKKRLENETMTQIKIPKQGEEGEIVINGRDRKGVLSAKTRIDVMVDSARQRQPFTHFLSFPISGKNIKDSFEDFKSDVLRQCDGDQGLDATIFQNPNKLHLTIGTLALLSEAEIQKAQEVLQQCQNDFIRPLLDGRPLVADIEGLEYMNDDPSSVDVLYAQVKLQDGSDRLQTVADSLVNQFTALGLMQKEYDRVKLHITIMNTLMRKDPSGTTVPRGQDRGQDRRAPMKDRESFDAANVLKKFGAHKFGTFNINSLHLSQRYSTGTDGYYACASSIDLP